MHNFPPGVFAEIDCVEDKILDKVKASVYKPGVVAFALSSDFWEIL